MRKFFPALILFLSLLVASFAHAETATSTGDRWAGPVTSATGLLWTAHWKSCDILIQNQTEDSLQLQLILLREQEPKQYTQILTLKKYSGPSISNGFYDYGFAEEPSIDAATGVQNKNIHRLKFKDSNSELTYKIQSVGYTDRRKLHTFELKCEASKK